MARTILVVDDHAPILSLFGMVLKKAGYDVLTAESPAGAMALAARCRRLDLLITDMTMPGRINGEDLAEAICAARPELRVILISGFIQEAVRSREGWSFLQKPFNSAALLETVRQVLGD